MISFSWRTKGKIRRTVFFSDWASSHFNAIYTHTYPHLPWLVLAKTYKNKDLHRQRALMSINIPEPNLSSLTQLLIREYLHVIIIHLVWWQWEKPKSLSCRFLENRRAVRSSFFFPFLFFSLLHATCAGAAARPSVSGRMKTAELASTSAPRVFVAPVQPDAGTGGWVDASVAANQSQILASISRPSASRRLSDISRRRLFPWFHRSGDSAISQPDNPHIFSLTWKIMAVSLDLPQTPP